MSGNGNQVPLAPNPRVPGPYPITSTPQRPEHYNPAGGGGGAYMAAGGPGAAQPPQPTMRVPPGQQPPPQAKLQQDLKNILGNYTPTQQCQTLPPRQFPNFPYNNRPQTRPTSHSSNRQQQYIAGAATGTTSLMYPPSVVYSHMGMTPSYQQQRSQYFPSNYNQYAMSYYNNSPGPSSFFYTSGSQQMTNPAGLAQNMTTGRNSGAPIVPQGAPSNSVTQSAPMQHHSQGNAHIHQTMPGKLGVQPPTKRPSYRIPIINPDTQQELIMQDVYSNDNQYANDESSERQTPQPASVTETNSIVEDFARRVSEAANQPSAAEIEMKASLYAKDNVDVTVQTQANTISIVVNSNIEKSENLPVNDSKCLGPDVAEGNDTPIVSAISDSPVIVPKSLPIIKKQAKPSEQPLALDNITTKPHNKHTKPVVPRSDEETTTNVNIESDPALPHDNEVDEIITVEVISVPTDNAVATPTSSSSNVQEIISTVTITDKVDYLKEVNESVPTVVPNVNVTSNVKVDKVESDTKEVSAPQTATELLAASIESIALKSVNVAEEEVEKEKESTSSVSQAQLKLNQSLAACRITETKMKGSTDPDAANANIPATNLPKKTDNNEGDINRNEKIPFVCDDATDKDNTVLDIKPDSSTLELEVAPEETVKAPAAPVFVPKYKYSEDQWSPMNTSGRRCYDLNLLKQIRDDPLSKNKPDIPKLEQCKVMKSVPNLDSLAFVTNKPTTDALFPNFLKPTGGAISKNMLRDPKKDGRSIIPNAKGSLKLMPNSMSSGGMKPNVIHVSLTGDVKLNETENAWKPTRFKRGNTGEEEYKTQELYKNFRGILNKLTPQKFDTLLEKVKLLEINTQTRLEGVIDLVFEKAIDEPNFSEAYAAMCNKLSMLNVPVDNPTSKSNTTEQVKFRPLLISRCQRLFVAAEDKKVQKLEQELATCTDPVRIKELELLLAEQHRRIRMRSVGNVRFIGELYKLKMLTAKIMAYCMDFLTETVEEEKLECLCKLLTTIGEQFENEFKEKLDYISKKMVDIVDRKNPKSQKISSRVRFMLQDVIELRNRRWVTKTVVDLQPRMMDQIQKEADQQHRQTELLNASMGGGSYRRDDGGRGKRGDSRRNQSYMDNSSNWKNSRNNYSVDTSKFKAAVTNKNLNEIKLAPQKTQWVHGSGAKASSNINPVISLPTTTTNKYSVLENVQTDPSVLRGNMMMGRDLQISYQLKRGSTDSSSFDMSGDYSLSRNGSSRSGSMGVPRPMGASRSTNAAPVSTEQPAEPKPKPPPVQTQTSVRQEQLTEQQKLRAQSIIDQCLLNPVENELLEEFKSRFEPQHHSSLISTILNIALEKSVKDRDLVAKSAIQLVTSNVISVKNYLSGLTEIIEFAPDLYIDIPMLYNYISAFIVPLIEKKYVTFKQILRISENVVAANQGNLFLKPLLKDLQTSMGPSFVKGKWLESELSLKQWMPDDQVTKFVEENKFEYLEGGAKCSEFVNKMTNPTEVHNKLLQLMNTDENCECIRNWVQDNIEKSSTSEDWFARALIQSLCEHALFGSQGRDVPPHFNQDRMNKYSELINEYDDTKSRRESNCLTGIQKLIHKLEHPQGVTLEIFQYLHEQYLISVEGFIAWQESELEPEGKGVMMKALTSFFLSIREADNDDSFSDE